jgi:hypothetical protein
MGRFAISGGTSLVTRGRFGAATASREIQAAAASASRSQIRASVATAAIAMS